MPRKPQDLLFISPSPQRSLPPSPPPSTTTITTRHHTPTTHHRPTLSSISIYTTSPSILTIKYHKPLGTWARIHRLGLPPRTPRLPHHMAPPHLLLKPICFFQPPSFHHPSHSQSQCNLRLHRLLCTILVAIISPRNAHPRTTHKRATKPYFHQPHHPGQN